MTRGTGPLDPPARRLSWPGLLAVLIAFVLVPPIVDLLRKTSIDFTFPDQAAAAGGLISEVVGVAIAIVVIAVLRWWPVVLHEPLRMRGWVWVVPTTVLVASVAMIDFSQLRVAGVGLALTVLLITLLVAVGEELVFRGVVLTFLRQRHGEGIAAVATTLIFGVCHLTGGVVYALSATVFGALLYFIRRVSGGILLPIVVHALWDFSVVSAYTGAGPWSEGSTSLTLFLVALGLLIAILVARGWRLPAPSTQGDVPDVGVNPPTEHERPS